MLGAGRISAAVWKQDEKRQDWRYVFNLYRLTPTNGHVTQLFQPTDLFDLIRALPMLAGIFADEPRLSEPSAQRLLGFKKTVEAIFSAPDGEVPAFLNRVQLNALEEFLAHLRATADTSAKSRYHLIAQEANIQILDAWLEEQLRHE
jgi:hypothetical protein